MRYVIEIGRDNLHQVCMSEVPDRFGRVCGWRGSTHDDHVFKLCPICFGRLKTVEWSSRENE